MRESFIFYQSFYEAIKDLDIETQAVIFQAICKKALYDEQIELTGIAKSLFTLIEPQLEANTKRYLDGKKGGRPKTTGYEKEKTTGYENKKPNNNVNVNDNDNVNNKKENIKEKASSEVDTSPDGGTAKANKHKYGDYKHVLLKDEELQALQREYPNWEELIKYLDEYIEMKGYKAKSHYLCIKKWVVNAAKEKAMRTPKEDREKTDEERIAEMRARFGGVIDDF